MENDSPKVQWMFFMNAWRERARERENVQEQFNPGLRYEIAQYYKLNVGFYR